MLSRWNLGLLIALILVLALRAVVQVDLAQPNHQVQLGDDMTYSPAYTSYSANPVFPNGRTLQAPVPGTIARGSQPFRFEATPAGAVRAGEELINPFEEGTDEKNASVERGQLAFQTFCVACHGADGGGGGSVAKRGFPPPPSLLTGKSRDMRDGQLFHILTCGQNSMPPFAVQLAPRQRWDVINYVRSLQPDPPLSAEANQTTTDEAESTP